MLGSQGKKLLFNTLLFLGIYCYKKEVTKTHENCNMSKTNVLTRADKLIASMETYHGSLVHEVQVLNALWILKNSSDQNAIQAGTEELCHTYILFFLFHQDIDDFKHYNSIVPSYGDF